MKDIMPQDGAPQVYETVTLAPEDAALAVAAVSYYVSSEQRTLEANWGGEGLRGLFATVGSALEDLDTLSAFVEHGRDLATRLANHSENPDRPVELCDKDIAMLGFSLFRFGNDGYVHATQALDSGGVGPVGEQARQKTREELNLRQEQSKRVFDQLTPLAERREIMWMVWSSGSASRIGKAALGN